MILKIIEDGIVPNGQYVARVVSIDGSQIDKKPVLEWLFEIEMPAESSGLFVCGCTYVIAGIYSELLKWAGRCTGREFTAGDLLDTDDLVGARVWVEVNTDETGGRISNDATIIRGYGMLETESNVSSSSRMPEFA